MAEAGQRLGLSRYTAADLAHHLAAAVGTEGLIGGQALDLESRSEHLDLERLEYIHSHKTGALFIACAQVGALLAGAREEEVGALAEHAKNVGLAYQITDDLLDVVGDPEVVGKDVAKDAAKVTFVKLLDVDGARALAAELLEFAVASLAPLGARAAPLRALALMVRDRRR